MSGEKVNSCMGKKSTLLNPTPPQTESIRYLLRINQSMLCGKIVRVRMSSSGYSEESSSSGSSANVIASSDHLLWELLLRLPVKSLLKFKSVSKHWLSLISDHCFIRRKSLEPEPVSALFLHRRSPAAGPHFEFVPLDPRRTCAAPFGSLTFADRPRGIQILQSCNGLFCCSNVENGRLEPKYYIYNPTTKQFATLPPLPRRSSVQVLGMNLAFDPSKSHVFKVVCVRGCRSSYDRFQILIYSSETGSWRVSQAPFTAPVSIDFTGGVYWNGAIHCVSPMGASLFFALNDELVQEMPMPPLPEGSDERRIRYFGECGGHLDLVEIYESSTRQFNVYEMKRIALAGLGNFKLI